MNKKGHLAMYEVNNAPNWFLIIIVVIVVFALIIEAGFLGMFFYSCYVKDQCIYPYFFGMGRFMAFPIVWGGYSSQSFTNSYQECYVNGIKVNCSEFSGDEHFCNNGVCNMNGVCPAPNSNMTIQDCIKQMENKP